MINGWELLICVCVCCPTCLCVCAFMDRRRSKVDAQRKHEAWKKLEADLFKTEQCKVCGCAAFRQQDGKWVCIRCHLVKSKNEEELTGKTAVKE